MNLATILQTGIQQLVAAGVPDPQREARLLLAMALEKSNTQLLIAGHEQVSEKKNIQYQSLIARRAQREPFAYICGEQEFWSLPFLVTSDVLIPRPETEYLLECVFTKRNKAATGLIADLCCGSGVIAVILAKQLGKKVIGLDISEKALRICQKNINRYQLMDQVQLVCSDLFSGIQLKQQFSLIVSNPPYVSREEMDAGLQPEVANFEPHLALDGGEQGIAVIRRIRQILPFLLQQNGEVFLEIGYTQGPLLRELFLQPITGCRDFVLVEIYKDYAGRDRILHARLA